MGRSWLQILILSLLIFVGVFQKILKKKKTYLGMNVSEIKHFCKAIA